MKKTFAKPSDVMKVQCASCPFRDNGKTEFRDLLIERALNEATPICHSTGDSNVVPLNKKVSKRPLACRGARNLQIEFFCAIGFLDAPTDEAWFAKWEETKND